MPVSLAQVGGLLETLAPHSFAEDWDNSGFNVNLHNHDIRAIMICLDVTPEAILEAAEKGCQLMISHHPLLFRAIKQVDHRTYQGRCIEMLIKNNISLYCAHTSMDTAPRGINRFLANRLGLTDQEYLEETNIGHYVEVAVHVPHSHVQQVREAMSAAGAGKIGDYSECTYNISGQGTFRPANGANPYIGRTGNMETVEEMRISAICPEEKLQMVLDAVHSVHPYEEPAISALVAKEPKAVNAGLGIVGNLTEDRSVPDVLRQIKEKLDIDSLRVAGDTAKTIKRIAVCGGAAGEMAGIARKKGAQLYLTGEIKHNFYVEEHDMILVEAGHYDTEKCFCELYAEGLQTLLDDVNYNLAIYIASLHRPYVNF